VVAVTGRDRFCGLAGYGRRFSLDKYGIYWAFPRGVAVATSYSCNLTSRGISPFRITKYWSPSRHVSNYRCAREPGVQETAIMSPTPRTRFAGRTYNLRHAAKVDQYFVIRNGEMPRESGCRNNSLQQQRPEEKPNKYHTYRARSVGHSQPIQQKRSLPVTATRCSYSWW